MRCMPLAVMSSTSRPKHCRRPSTSPITRSTAAWHSMMLMPGCRRALSSSALSTSLPVTSAACTTRLQRDQSSTASTAGVSRHRPAQILFHLPFPYFCIHFDTNEKEMRFMIHTVDYKNIGHKRKQQAEAWRQMLQMTKPIIGHFCLFDRTSPAVAGGHTGCCLLRDLVLVSQGPSGSHDHRHYDVCGFLLLSAHAKALP